jgi:hypothetical protein
MGAANSVIECAFTKSHHTNIEKKARGSRRIFGIAPIGGVAPRLPSLMRLSLRSFGVLLGFALLGYLVFRSGPAVVWKQLQAIGWGSDPRECVC